MRRRWPFGVMLLGCLVSLLAISGGGVRAKPADAVPAGGAAGDSVSLALKLEPLAYPGAVLASPPGQGLNNINGILFPSQNMVQVEASKPATLALGGAKVTLGLVKQDFEVKFDGGSVKLKRTADGMSFEPARIRLAADRDYILYLPYGYVYQSGGTLWRRGQAQGMAFYRSAGVQQAVLNDQVVRIYDSNVDGFYRLGEDSCAVTAAGADVGVYAPLGKLLATASGIYEVAELAADGSKVELKRQPVSTGQLAVSFAAPNLKAQVAFGSPETGLNFVTAPQQAAATVSVVPGRYGLNYGLVFSAENKTVATLVPGKLETTAVSQGQTAKVEMGAPFAMEFVADVAAGKLTINSSKFHIRGKAGEEYTNIRWTSEPEVKLVAGGKTTALGKMSFG